MQSKPGINPSATHHMYFIAIVCPPELDKKILQYKYWMKEQFGSVAALKSPAHITLIQPFWLEENKEANLKSSLELFISDMEELEIQLEGFSHFGKRVLFVRVQENSSLEELKNQVENYFVRMYGDIIKKDDRPFHPHITIANRDMKPADFEKAWQHFSNKIFKEKFQTQTISLLKLTNGKWNMTGEKRW
ncbi:MAG TPA: RNA 2',3'-cyclic phosphodiesterase [Chitinophagaceae bacterium]